MTKSPDDTAPGINQLVSEATARLLAAHVPSADTDAEILLAHVLGISRGELATRMVREGDSSESATPAGSAEQIATFDGYISRRASREPLQHITGIAWFRSLTLNVGPGVFVPRPETELLAGMAIDALRVMPDPAPIAVDLGTGSGAIAISIAKEVPHASVFALEKSHEAFEWASRNALENNAENLVLVQGEIAGGQLLDRFPELRGQVSVLASNPPYIPTDAIPRDPEVQLFDPEMALYGGEDGLDVVREIAQVARDLVRPGGLLAIEHGEEQGESIRNIFALAGWSLPQTHQDLLGRDRYTTATHP